MNSSNEFNSLTKDLSFKELCTGLRPYHYVLGAFLLMSHFLAVYACATTDTSTYAKLFEYAAFISALAIACFVIFLLIRYYEKRRDSHPVIVTGPEGLTKPQDVDAQFFDAVHPIFAADDLKWESIKRIDILAHVGVEHVVDISNKLGQLKPQKEKVQINLLIRHPTVESKSRFKRLETIRTFVDKHKFDFNVRTYSAPPSFRCLFAEYVGTTANRQNLIAFYKWTPLKSTKAFGKYRLYGDNHEFAIAGKDLFQHYWGKSNLHTIVFDFDDTLVDTTSIQVDAWIQTIAKKEWEQHLKEAIKKNLQQTEKIQKDMTRIFLEKQLARDIFETIFETEGDLDYDEFNEARYTKRAELTEERVDFYPSAINTLKKLSERYQMVIVSSTSEELILRVLEKYRITNLFSFIFGKESPSFEWNESILDKSRQYIKISNMLGIPLERMIVVGDSNNDYKSASLLGITFIEARMNAAKHGLRTLINLEDGERLEFSFGEFTSGGFEKELENAETKVDNYFTELFN